MKSTHVITMTFNNGEVKETLSFASSENKAIEIASAYNSNIMEMYLSGAVNYLYSYITK
jgi:hypothetical protein